MPAYTVVNVFAVGFVIIAIGNAFTLIVVVWLTVVAVFVILVAPPNVEVMVPIAILFIVCVEVEVVNVMVVDQSFVPDGSVIVWETVVSNAITLL